MIAPLQNLPAAYELQRQLQRSIFYSSTGLALCRHRKELHQAETQARQLQQDLAGAGEAQQWLRTALQEAKQAAATGKQDLASELSSLKQHTQQLQTDLQVIWRLSMWAVPTLHLQAFPQHYTCV